MDDDDLEIPALLWGPLIAQSIFATELLRAPPAASDSLVEKLRAAAEQISSIDTGLATASAYLRGLAEFIEAGADDPISSWSPELLRGGKA